MTNQQKLQTLRNLTGPSLYSVIIKELGPGTIHIPLDDGIPESRNLKIRAEFNSPEFEENRWKSYIGLWRSGTTYLPGRSGEY